MVGYAERPTALRYAAAVVFVALAVVMRSSLPLAKGDVPFASFLAAIAAAAWFGGWGPALLSMALGFVVSELLFVEHAHPGWAADRNDIATIYSYAVAGLAIFVLTLAMSRARAAATARQTELVREIEKRIQAEEELRRAHDDLESRVRQRTIELERSNAELRQFAFVASHDLQEPLRTVANFTQLLADRYGPQLDKDAREFMAYAISGAVRMRSLIEDLLAYSRLGSQGGALECVDCNVALGSAVANLQALITENAALITNGELPQLLANAPQIERLFQNVVGNSIKYRSVEPPRVHISAVRSAGDWIFSVRDNGIGIEPRYSERIFGIFQRLHRPENYPGTGIGLALCRKIVERHGGKIWVESELGQGATFFFSMPAAREESAVVNESRR